ncbi:hypothetical protein FO519_006580 [Halicephalobus sp. NKZ332]|nr:hypothetical protein FO519_006580 [Halicephalobus sp. NKZ332]
MITPKNILVTGGCGFIGSNFVNYIFKAWPQTKIVNFDKLILNSDVNYIDEEVKKSGRYEVVLGDIKNKEIISEILEKNEIDVVIHFAADCTSTRCYSEPSEAVQNNVLSYISLLEAVKEYNKLSKFIHISTDEVYGDSGLESDEIPKIEKELLCPGNPYAATKVAGEAYSNLFLFFGLPIVILRINNIFGPNQWDVKLVPRFIDVAVKKQKFTVQGSGKQLRSWLFVDDAAEGVKLAVEKGVVGQVYNLGTYYEKNVLDLAYAVQAEVDRQLGRDPSPVEFISIPDRPYNDMRYLIDISKAKKELGWEPKTSFEDGLQKVVESSLKPHFPVKMSVAIFGGNGWIGQQVQKLLKIRQIPFKVARSKVGINSTKEIINELNQLSVTHVLCCTGRTHGGGVKTIEYLEGGPEKAFENVRDNLYCPIALSHICEELGIHYTYVGTGYLFAYDESHPIGGAGFKDDDLPTFFGNSYSVVKGFTDRMINSLPILESVNARITLPINFQLDEERNLLAKIINYRQIFDIPVSITIVDDCFPALFSLMERRFGGSINLVNPEPISLHGILQLYKKIVDPQLHDYEVVGADSEKGKELLATKGNCALATDKLESLYPNILSSTKALEKGFQSIKAT